MKIQRFKGKLKKSGEVLTNLSLYIEDDDYWFVKDLKRIDGAEYNGIMYAENEFLELEEYFEEINNKDKIDIFDMDWFIKAQTAK